jgi:hypothetical protein
MDDAQRRTTDAFQVVRGMQSFGGRETDAQRDAERGQAAFGEAALQDAAQRDPVNVIHHQKRPIFVFAHVEHADHVGVADQPRDARLLEKHGAYVGIRAQVRMQALHRVQAREAALAPRGKLDLAHATAGQDLHAAVRGRRRA